MGVHRFDATELQVKPLQVQMGGPAVDSMGIQAPAAEPSASTPSVQQTAKITPPTTGGPA